MDGVRLKLITYFTVFVALFGVISAYSVDRSALAANLELHANSELAYNSPNNTHLGEAMRFEYSNTISLATFSFKQISSKRSLSSLCSTNSGLTFGCAVINNSRNDVVLSQNLNSDKLLYLQEFRV